MMLLFRLSTSDTTPIEFKVGFSLRMTGTDETMLYRYGAPPLSDPIPDLAAVEPVTKDELEHIGGRQVRRSFSDLRDAERYIEHITAAMRATYSYWQRAEAFHGSRDIQIPTPDESGSGSY